MDETSAIGGVFEAAQSGRSVPESLWDLWTAGAAQVLTFSNARSAFAHVIAGFGPRRVWVPAYMCRDMAEAAPKALFYHVDDTFSPDVQVLDASLRPGDLLLGFNPFGRPNEVFRKLVQSHPDVIFVEDNAQALHTASHPWGHVQIYSPRKLLGVPDGGLLVDRAGLLPVPKQRPASTARLRRAGLMRARDPLDRENERWYQAFREAEASMTISDQGMSATTKRVLASSAWRNIAETRRANYARLHSRLADLAFLPDRKPAWVPLGFPIRVRDAAELARDLAVYRVFAPRHWPELAGPNLATSERAMHHQMLTLPCDQRYTEEDMDRVSRVLRKALS
ncbi:hypothetical protein [Pacificoceanicola onchidii]|uniref:hypothetical protein n=1 Tax=Pacificoceanicola onchidii TaxID=2562685 RepID=UPI0010A5EF81|nr:hypothetical protein [Pacificoceanicola onchidii]